MGTPPQNQSGGRGLFQPRLLENRVQETGFQVLIPVDGNRDGLAALDHDVVTAVDSVNLPAMVEQQPDHLFAAHRH